LDALEQISSSGDPNDGLAMVSYHVSQFPESDQAVFDRLFRYIEGRYLRVDDVFDDILKSK
jgi:hypothetical protein